MRLDCGVTAEGLLLGLRRLCVVKVIAQFRYLQMVRLCGGLSYSNTHSNVLETFTVSDLFIVGAVQSEEFDDVGSPKLSLVLDVGDRFEFEG